MGDLLKEAIADAKAVRETALQNAKMALEEAFTPQLKSMLSAKLKEEEGVPYEEDESGDGMDDDEVDTDVVDTPNGSDGEADEEAPVADEPSATAGEDEESGVPGSAEETEYEEDETGDGMDEDEVPNEGEELNQEAVHDEDEDHDEEEVDESTLDLESIIKELESEVEAEEGAYGEDEEMDEEEEVPAEEAEEVPAEEAEEMPAEEDEELEVDEDLWKEGEGDDDDEDDDVEESKIQSELKEYKEAVKFLKNKLHEVNILNAKLLFTNKLFKEFALNNNQKLKVVETFDRAQTTREIKLVYSTLAEQFGDNTSIVTKKSISESASTAVSSTKPSKESRKVISEEVEVANRFKKLAGLL